jgi:hypothetical protein
MGWNLNDLTLASGAPQIGGQATGYVFDAQNTQLFFTLVLISTSTNFGGISVDGTITT